MVSLLALCPQLLPVSLLSERHIDGHDYMWAISEMIDSAKELIFIMVWSSTHRVTSIFMFALWSLLYFRIGGLLQSCTSVDLLHTSLNGG